MQKKTQQYGHGGGRGEQAQPDAWPRSGREGGGRETGRRGPSEGTRPRQESLSRWEGEGGPTPSGHDERDWQRAERAPQEARQGWERDAQFGRPGADARGTRTRDGAWAPDAPVGAYGHDAEGSVYGGDGAGALRGFGEGSIRRFRQHGRGMQHEGANLAGYGHAYTTAPPARRRASAGWASARPTVPAVRRPAPRQKPKGYRRADDRISKKSASSSRAGRVDASGSRSRRPGRVLTPAVASARTSAQTSSSTCTASRTCERLRRSARARRTRRRRPPRSRAAVGREAKNGVDSSRSFRPERARVGAIGERYGRGHVVACAPMRPRRGLPRPRRPSQLLRLPMRARRDGAGARGVRAARPRRPAAEAAGVEGGPRGLEAVPYAAAGGDPGCRAARRPPSASPSASSPRARASPCSRTPRAAQPGATARRRALPAASKGALSIVVVPRASAGASAVCVPTSSALECLVGPKDAALDDVLLAHGPAERARRVGFEAPATMAPAAWFAADLEGTPALCVSPADGAREAREGAAAPGPDVACFTIAYGPESASLERPMPGSPRARGAVRGVVARATRFRGGWAAAGARGARRAVQPTPAAGDGPYGASARA